MLKKAIVSTFGILLLAGCQTAGTTRTIPAGQSIRLDFATSLNADCTPTGEVTARLVSGPSNGTVQIDKTMANPTYLQSNQRYVCNTRKVPGTRVTYTPKPGFTGTDNVAVEMFFPSGVNRTNSYTIIVK